MNKKFSFLEPGERMIFFSKGVTTRETILNPLVLLLLPPMIGFSMGISIDLLLLPHEFVTAMGILFTLMYFFMLINFIIRLITAKSILTDRRVILIAYRMSWDRAEIPLNEIEEIFIKSSSVHIVRKSQKALKDIPIAKAKAFVDAYQKFISSHRAV